MRTLPSIIDENPQIFKPFINNSIEIFNSSPNENTDYEIQIEKVIDKSNFDELLPFTSNYLSMRKKISRDKFKIWFDNSVIRNKAGEVGHFSLENPKSKELFNDLTFSVDLDIEKDILKLYCCGLSGDDLAIQSSSAMVEKEIGWFNPNLATTEGTTIFLPESIKKFNEKEKNFSWLKVLATHQVGHVEFGTFKFKLKNESKFFNNLRFEIANNENISENKEITDMTNFFKFFDDIKLAQDIFSIFEAYRVDQKIINKYRGIKKSYLDVQDSCLVGRPEIKDLPGREQLLELLIRYSLNDLDQKVAKNLQSSFSKLLSLLNVLKDNQSSIEDTSEATLRAYKILIDIKNSQEKDLDEFDYDQDFQYEFDEEDFDQIIEYFNLSSSETYSENVEDSDKLPENLEQSDQIDQQQEDLDYNSPQEVEFWGEFKPELSQLLFEMNTNESEFSEEGDLSELSQEQIEEMLKDSVEESQNQEDDQVSESDITQNLEDALNDMQMEKSEEDQSKFADKFDHFDEEGKPLPAWASPAVRKVSAVMQARGMGSSSMAAAAMTQAVMESGINIAVQDANKYATIQLQNLNNKQKTALQNALTVAGMDRANLSARLQGAVTNAQALLTVDVKNLDAAQKNTLRMLREPLLKEADWQIHLIEDASGDSSTWRTHRQALRDITKASDIYNVTWPSKPE